jgi:hypothetical protein
LERLAVAAHDARRFYYMESPDTPHHAGREPGIGYLEDYMDLFVERERLDAKLEQIRNPMTAEELLEKLSIAVTVCINRSERTPGRYKKRNSKRDWQDARERGS